MIPYGVTYKGAINRYSPKFSISQCNINLSLKSVSEMKVTKDQERCIAALRGLLGKKAQKAMFKICVDSGEFTYQDLVRNEN
jgi:hypothetical protein